MIPLTFPALAKSAWSAVVWLFTSPAGRALLLVAALAGALWWFGASRYDAGHAKGSADVQKAFDKYVADASAAQLKAEAEARAKEETQREAYDKVVRDTALEKENVLRNVATRIDAAVANGTLRLRREWAGCETLRLSKTAEAAGLADDLVRVRSESAKRIVRIATEADIRERELQKALTVCYATED